MLGGPKDITKKLSKSRFSARNFLDMNCTRLALHMHFLIADGI